MPKGAAHVLSLVLVLGAIFLVRELGGSHGERVFLDQQPPAVTDDGISVYFSPHGGCEAAVVDRINSAQHSIDMQAYTFTSVPIAQALADAENRGVAVRAVLDEQATSEHDTEALYLKDHGIAVYTDGDHPIAHNKVMVFDARTVITGSFNFTKQAENANAENLIILADRPTIAGAYERNFEFHLSHSQPFTGMLQPMREHTR
jgi:phosphatidylserine/phosphatidylglycerophosphate/cardiolipin synthase-like enzyme